jgi:hypothetical protein
MDVQLAVAIAKEIQDMVIAPPQRKPMTEEQAFDLFGISYNISVIRTVEAAHGIKEQA